jgi:hypothetical protein
VAALTELQQNGCAPALEQSHPYKAFATNGFAEAVDELAAVREDSGRKVAAKSICAAVPFAKDSRLRPVAGDLPAHFFAGRDTRTLAIRFILEIRKEMRSFSGGRANRGNRHPYFEFETSGAIGRLAMIITHRICPGTVSAVLAESYENLQHRNRQLPPLAPGDMVANPVTWVRLYSGSRRTPSSLATRAEEFLTTPTKSYLFSNIVVAAQKNKSDFLSRCSGAFANSVKFSARQWFSPYAEADQLARQWKEADPDLKRKLPAMFAPVSAGDLKFCGRVAARMLPSALPMWQDPHCRKPDALRQKMTSRGNSSFGSKIASERPRAELSR